MTDLEFAIQSSKELEHLLAEKLGATGKGLHEKTSSVQRRLPGSTVRNLRYVATIRNKLVHEPAYSRIDDRARFERVCGEAIRELRASTPDGSRWAPWRKIGGGGRPDRGSRRRISVAVGAIAACATFAVCGMQRLALAEAVILTIIAFVAGYFWRFVSIALFSAGTVYAAVRIFGMARAWLGHAGGH